MSRLTKQEYYDLMVDTIKEPSLAPPGSGYTCVYRGPNGLKCAVGVLIPDEDYRESFEQKIAVCLPEELLDKIMPEGLEEDNLSEIQLCHDATTNSENNTYFREEFIANLNELKCFSDIQKRDPICPSQLLPSTPI